jgi:hypothetical protein
MSFILQGTTSVSGGGTGSSSLALNNVLLGNGTSPLQVVAPGTTGNVLQSNGTTWQSAAAGGSSALVFISSQTVSTSVAEVNFTTGFSSTYDQYILQYFNVRSDSGGAGYLSARVYINSSLQTSNYKNTLWSMGGTTINGSNTGGLAYVNLSDYGTYTATTSSFNGQISFLNTNTSSRFSAIATNYHQESPASNEGYLQYGGFHNPTAGVLTGIQFFLQYNPTTIYFTSGTFRLYGITKS